MPHDRVRPLILLVEDYADTRELYAFYLTLNGYRVEEADEGFIAIDKATRLRPDDLILMDLSLPGMDGWEATARLKQDERTAAVPFIALTAHALPNEHARAIASGCDAAVVTKPCLPEALLREVTQMLANTTARATDHAAVSGPEETKEG